MSTSPHRYLNKVLLKGRLGKDPELRSMPSGDPVCNFSIATRNGKHVEWHKIVAYEFLAHYAKDAFASGDFVYIEAEIRTREFQTSEDKALNRKPRKVLELITHEAHLLAKRGAGSETGDDDLQAAGSGDGLPQVAASLESQGGDTGASGLPTYI